MEKVEVRNTYKVYQTSQVCYFMFEDFQVSCLFHTIQVCITLQPHVPQEFIFLVVLLVLEYLQLVQD